MALWKDIKYTTLQKMFSVSGSQREIPNDSSTMEYINAMPAACNEALELLSTAGKFIIKDFVYTNYPFENMLGKDTFKTYSVVNDHISFEAVRPGSFYFKIQGKPTMCKLFLGNIELLDFYPEDNEINYKDFTVFKGNVPYPENVEEGAVVSLYVEAKSPVYVTNACFYDCTFEADEDVPQYEKYIRLKLDEILDDFYQLAPAELYSLGESGNDYIVADKYYQEAYKTLVIERERPGIYLIHYRAYPQALTLDTPDDYELVLDPEVAALLPLYMASQLYKDDDNAIATVYRNEFEVGRDALSQGPQIPKKEKFVTSSGWA